MARAYKIALNCGHVRLITIGSNEDSDAREKGWAYCFKHEEFLAISDWRAEPGDELCDCGKGAYCPQFGTLFNSLPPVFAEDNRRTIEAISGR